MAKIYHTPPNAGRKALATAGALVVPFASAALAWWAMAPLEAWPLLSGAAALTASIALPSVAAGVAAAWWVRRPVRRRQAPRQF